MQKVVKLDLSDLHPQKVKFKLSTTAETEHTLKAFTLRVQLYASKTFGAERLEKAIANRDLTVLPELAWYVLEDKAPFKDSFENFLDAVESYADRAAVVDAILATTGLSQPKLDGLVKQLEDSEKKDSAPAQAPTGASSSTESPASTDTPSSSS